MERDTVGNGPVKVLFYARTAVNLNYINKGEDLKIIIEKMLYVIKYSSRTGEGIEKDTWRGRGPERYDLLRRAYAPIGNECTIEKLYETKD